MKKDDIELFVHFLFLVGFSVSVAYLVGRQAAGWTAFFGYWMLRLYRYEQSR